MSSAEGHYGRDTEVDAANGAINAADADPVQHGALAAPFHSDVAPTAPGEEEVDFAAAADGSRLAGPIGSKTGDHHRDIVENEPEIQIRHGGAQVDVEFVTVIAEIPGSERPEEVVVMGGHYDSWDVGQGVHDDGAACIAAWQALRLIHRLGLQPRRTLRVVLWTNEENGLRGGNVYHDELSAEEVANHVAAIEMDGGAERPRGFGFGLLGVDYDAEEPDPTYEDALRKLEQIGRLLGPIDAHEILRGGGGADIGPLMRSGVPGLGLRTVGEHYFDWHHTHADTLDKLDIENFRRAIALLGVTGFVLADMPERLVPRQ